MIYKVNILRKRLVSVELSEKKTASKIADELCDSGWDVQEVRMFIKTKTAKLLISMDTDDITRKKLIEDIEAILLSQTIRAGELK